MSARRYCVVLGALLIVLARPLDADEWIAMTVSPLQSFAPTNVSVRVRIQPHKENRVLEVLIDSGEFYRSSQIPLDGEGAPRTVTVELRNLPGGDYQVVGSLANSAGRERASVRQNVQVLQALGTER
jgi:hypothetical protein